MTDNQKPPVRSLREVALYIVAHFDARRAGGAACYVCYAGAGDTHARGCPAEELREALERQLPTSGRVSSPSPTCGECQSVGGMLEHSTWCETGHLEMRNRLLDQEWETALPVARPEDGVVAAAGHARLVINFPNGTNSGPELTELIPPRVLERVRSIITTAIYEDLVASS